MGIGLARGDTLVGDTRTRRRASQVCGGEAVRRAERLGQATREETRRLRVDAAVRGVVAPGADMASVRVDGEPAWILQLRAG